MVEAVGERTLSYREIVGLGEVNHVFVVETCQGEWVVRFHKDPLETENYEKEAWCLNQMHMAGVPVPEFVGRGCVQDVCFIVQSFIPGENGHERRSPELWRLLGQYCRAINEFPIDESAPGSLFQRFGRDVVQNWRSHIAYNLKQLNSDDPLIGLGAYERGQQGLLRSRFSGLEERVDRFGLTHGDLVPRNVLITPQGTPVLVDWGSAFTGPCPFTDFNRIWSDVDTNEFALSELQSFADGYQIQLESMLDTMQDLWLLGRIDVVRWAIDRRPDRVKELAESAKLATDRWL